MNNFDKILLALHQLHEENKQYDGDSQYTFHRLLDWNGGFNKERSDAEWLIALYEDLVICHQNQLPTKEEVE